MHKHRCTSCNCLTNMQSGTVVMHTSKEEEEVTHSGLSALAAHAYKQMHTTVPLEIWALLTSCPSSCCASGNGCSHAAMLAASPGCLCSMSSSYTAWPSLYRRSSSEAAYATQ
eukprot:GHUV01045163.1.p2 GENE.GHUV01045163.1~~GHUV01045163.1.p2  ORF type:complete len:113 (+),score=9.97 GHUV01045163.1:86-424(+)